MSKITADAGIDKIKDDADKWRFLSLFLEGVKALINGGLGFSDNFDAKGVSVTFATANTDVATAHGLGRVPVGYVVTSLSVNMVVYTGASAWTSSTIYLKASAAGTATLTLY